MESVCFKIGKNDHLEIEGNYTKGCPARLYLKNGDPGYPAEASEFDIDRVIYNNININNVIEYLNGFEKLAERCIEEIEGG